MEICGISISAWRLVRSEAQTSPNASKLTPNHGSEAQCNDWQQGRLSQCVADEGYFTTGLIFHKKYGEAPTVSPAVKMSETQPRISQPVPLIGEHSSEILKEFGYSEDQITEFENNKVITIER